MRLPTLLAIIAVLIIAGIGGTVWLANAPMQPKIQETHLVLPDDRIAH